MAEYFALTLTQPWASLIAHRKKTIETRSWKPGAGHVGRRIAVHAAKNLEPVGGEMGFRRQCTARPFAQALLEAGYVRTQLFSDAPAAVATPPPEELLDFAQLLNERGGIVATATLARVGPTQQAMSEMLRRAGTAAEKRRVELELAFGDYSEGRWAWKLTDIVRIGPPLACKGGRGLWPVPADVAMRLLAHEEEDATPPFAEGAPEALAEVCAQAGHPLRGSTCLCGANHL